MVLLLRSRFGAIAAIGAIAVAALAVGCSSATTPVTGTAGAASTSPTDPAVDAPPDDGSAVVAAYTQAEVQKLFDARCVKCHDAKSTSLDLRAPFTESTIGVRPGSTAGKTVCGTDGRMTARIVPGDREASLLWHKVKGTQDCGKAMPYGTDSKPLNATELERLGLYIDELGK
jgi:hypothetical protein